MNYWLELFTRDSWDEFREAGANVVGFRHTMSGYVRKVQPGDVFLCYVTGGAKEWVGALTVVGPSTDTTRIWSEEQFPVRLAVKPDVVLEPGCGVRLGDLQGRVAFHPKNEGRGKLSGFLRRSFSRFEAADGQLLVKLLKKAAPSSKPS